MRAAMEHEQLVSDAFSRGIVSNHTHIVLNDPGDAARRDMNELIVLPLRNCPTRSRAWDKMDELSHILSVIEVCPHTPLTPPAPLEPRVARVPLRLPSPPAQNPCLPP